MPNRLIEWVVVTSVLIGLLLIVADVIRPQIEKVVNPLAEITRFIQTP